MPQPPVSSTRRLTRLYIASLSAVAILAILGQVVVQSMLRQQNLNSKVIDKATDYQMLSWRLREAALALKIEEANPQDPLQEIRKNLGRWDRADKDLQAAIAQAPIREMNRAEISQRVAALAPIHQHIKEASETLLALSTRPITSADKEAEKLKCLRKIRGDGKDFSDAINQLISTYNQQAQVGIQQLQLIEYSLLGLLTLVLLLEGLLVFRPAVERLQMALNELAIALDRTQKTADQLAVEQAQSEQLLLNILPRPIAKRLKVASESNAGQTYIADGFAEVTVLFADIVGFTALSARISPQQLVALLNQIFSRFDQLAEQHSLEKIKTIGDAYMVVGGLPNFRADHAEAVSNMAIEMQAAIEQFNQDTGESFSIRIGINTGPVVAGVIGIKKFIYDLWGDTVNIASRMESQSIAGCIQVTEATYQQIKTTHFLEHRGTIQVKGRGEMSTYWLKGRKEALVGVR